MFYIDELLTRDENCYLLLIDGNVIGKAPIKEDLVLNSQYEWQDTDIRSVVDLFMDSMKQTFKNMRQLQGHGQQLIGRAIADDPTLAAKGYENIAAGKTPLDTKYLTIPLFVRAQSAYTLPNMEFIFVNKDDSNTHIKNAEAFLWKVSGVAQAEYEETEFDKEKNEKVIKTYKTYFTPSHNNKPGYKYQKDEKAPSKDAKGFVIQKGNVKIEHLSLQGMNISLSKELNLEGFPQAIRISLIFKDTQRRYPAEAIKILKMAANQDTSVFVDKGTPIKTKRISMTQSTTSSSNGSPTNSSGRNQ